MIETRPFTDRIDKHPFHRHVAPRYSAGTDCRLCTGVVPRLFNVDGAASEIDFQTPTTEEVQA